MTDRLIVALDDPDVSRAERLYARLYHEVGVRFFKIGVATLFDHSGYELARTIANFGTGTSLFLDLKVYDTRDTVERTVRRAFDLGARFVTVHATPSMLEAAMRAKPQDVRHKVLAVGRLSDDTSLTDIGLPTDARSQDVWMGSASTMSDGCVTNLETIRWLRPTCPSKVFVKAGIRRVGDSPDSHVAPATPAEVICAGADYLVVGRPIWQADDPVAVARAIIEEMGGAE